MSEFNCSPMDMLRRLGSGVRPDAASGGAPSLARTQGASFADLLASARSGALQSGQSLRLATGVSAASLSAEQLQRLSATTDAAEGAGATRLLALIDNRAVTIDVATRTVLSVHDAAAPRPRAGAPVLTGIDSVVIVPAAVGAEAAHTAPPVRGLPDNPSLARLLGADPRGKGLAGA